MYLPTNTTSDKREMMSMNETKKYKKNYFHFK